MTQAQPLPPADYLRLRLLYDPETGSLTWKRYENASRSWNGKHADKPAGTLSNGYLRLRLDGKLYLGARLAFKIMTGHDPESLVDHHNGNTVDMTWENLRPATKSQNTANGRSASKKGLPRGVRVQRNGRFQAQIKTKQGQKGLGTFDTPEEAHAAYLAAAEQHHGSYALHNRRVNEHLSQ